MTQIEYAKVGKITKQMEQIAQQEDVDSTSLRENVARGLAVVLANKN